MSKFVTLHGFGGGSNGGNNSGELNFDVVAYESEETLLADTPAENTIGVVTTTEITSWIFSADEPTEPTEGMVLFTVATSSPVEFNALKKNAIQVYPLSAKQYVNSVWTVTRVMIYQLGEWVDWWDGTLYSAGDEYPVITGGWNIAKTAAGSATKAASEVNVNLRGTGGAVGFILNTNKKVNVSNFSTLSAIVSDVSQTVGQGTFVKTYFGLFKYLPSSVTMGNIDSLGVVKTRINNGNTNISVDVSGITGEYYVAFFSALGGSASYYVNYNVKEAKLA